MKKLALKVHSPEYRILLIVTTAGLFACPANASDLQEDGACWMENDTDIPASVLRAAAVPSQKAVPIHSGPKVQPAAVSWMKPLPSSVPQAIPRKVGAGSQRSGWDKSAALATAATIQLAKASEAAVRLADMAVKQMAGTAGEPARPPLATELCTPAKRGRKPNKQQLVETPLLPSCQSKKQEQQNRWKRLMEQLP